MQRLAETGSDAGNLLSVNGKTLVSVYGQIISILRNRLGQNHADYFAVPVEEAGGILWNTSLSGPVVPASSLPGEERERLETKAQRINTDIRGLASQMRGEGSASQVVASLLEHALSQPPGDWLYSVNGKPVQIMWGHAASGSDAAIRLPAAVMPAASSRTVPATPAAQGDAALPPDVAAFASATEAIGKEPSPPPQKNWTRWLVRLIVLALLLAALLFGLRSCGEELWPKPVDLGDQIQKAEDASRQLEAEIAGKQAEKPTLMCMQDDPPPVPEPVREPIAPVVPQSPPVQEAAPAPEPKPEPKPAPESKPAVKAPPAKPVAKEPAPAKLACKPQLPGDEPEVVMIIDASGSMNESFGSTTRLSAAKTAAAGMIRGLPSGVDVGLVEFGACGQVRRDKFYSSGQRSALIGEINSLQPRQGTPLAAAITRAGAVASNSVDSVIVVVSDGDDSCGGDPCAAARALKASKPNVIINVIDMSTSASDRKVLQCVASAGGGRLLNSTSAGDMNRKMKDAAGPANCKP